MLQPGRGDPCSEWGAYWGHTQTPHALLLWTRERLVLPHPVQGKWHVSYFGRAGPAQKEASGARQRVCPAKSESKGVGCSAGADPLRKGSERAGWGPGCRLGPQGWVLRFVQYPVLAPSSRECSTQLLSPARFRNRGRGRCGVWLELGPRSACAADQLRELSKPPGWASPPHPHPPTRPLPRWVMRPLPRALHAEDQVPALTGANLEKVARTTRIKVAHFRTSWKPL